MCVCVCVCKREREREREIERERETEVSHMVLNVLHIYCTIAVYTLCAPTYSIARSMRTTTCRWHLRDSRWSLKASKKSLSRDYSTK